LRGETSRIRLETLTLAFTNVLKKEVKEEVKKRKWKKGSERGSEKSVKEERELRGEVLYRKRGITCTVTRGWTWTKGGKEYEIWSEKGWREDGKRRE
jgi:hypothetical protein